MFELFSYKYQNHNIMKKNILFLFLLAILIISCPATIFAQDTSPVSKFSITTYTGGGVRIGLSDNLSGAVGVGIGAKYHFCDHWSLNFGLDFLYFDNGSQRGLIILQMPLQMEYQLKYFYVNGGFYLLPGVKMGSNSNITCLVRAALGVGGRIPLTSRDCLTIGAQFFQNIDFAFSKPNNLNDLSETVMLKIGYEHRF